jgi:hypothetical protein
MPVSPGRSIRSVRRLLGKDCARWLSSTCSVVTVVNATRVPTKNPTDKSHSPQLFVINILGISFTSIAAAPGRSGGTMRRRERLGILTSTFYQWWRRAPDGANSPESTQHRQLRRQLHSTRGGYAVTLDPTRSYMITVQNSWVASSRRCWTATASKANQPQSKIRWPPR